MKRFHLTEELDVVYQENNYLRDLISSLNGEKEKIVKDYEGKLNALEYEKHILWKEYDDNNRSFDFKINKLNIEIESLKCSLETNLHERNSLTEEYKKLEERYRVSNEYIKLLPTPQEVDSLNKNLYDVKRLTEKYKSKLQLSEMSLRKVEQELQQKSIELDNIKDKEVIMKSQIDFLGEKLSATHCVNIKKEEQDASDWYFTPDLIDDMRLTIERYKTDMSHLKQILEAEKKKFDQMVKSDRQKIDELQIQLENESETIVTLKKELEKKQYQCQDLENKLKSLTCRNQDILGNMMDLQIEINRLDAFETDKNQILLKQLISEIYLSVREIEAVSESLLKLVKKENFDISMLLCSEIGNLTVSDSDNILNEMSLKHYLGLLNESRKQLSDIKNLIIQFYSDSIASDLKFCIIQ